MELVGFTGLLSELSHWRCTGHCYACEGQCCPRYHWIFVRGCYIEGVLQICRVGQREEKG